MKISVIIPTYKPQDYLWECLTSLINQSFSKNQFEIIIVLNGCSDPWRDRIQTFINGNMQDMHVNFLQTNIAGVSNARNLGLDYATGEYITFIDDDDYISTSYLEELFNIASKKVVSLCFPLAFVDGSNITEPFYITADYLKYRDKQKIEYFYPKRFFSGPVYKLIHRDIIGNRRFNPSFAKGEDSLFMFLISDRFKYVAFTSTKAIYYRRFRVDSVTMKETSIFDTMLNRMQMIKEYSHIYFSNISNYHFRFYISRIYSSIKAIIHEVVLKIKAVFGLSKIKR